jgi:hypothetical protein
MSQADSPYYPSASQERQDDCCFRRHQRHLYACRRRPLPAVTAFTHERRRARGPTPTRARPRRPHRHSTCRLYLTGETLTRRVSPICISRSSVHCPHTGSATRRWTRSAAYGKIRVELGRRGDVRSHPCGCGRSTATAERRPEDCHFRETIALVGDSKLELAATSLVLATNDHDPTYLFVNAERKGAAIRYRSPEFSNAPEYLPASVGGTPIGFSGASLGGSCSPSARPRVRPVTRGGTRLNAEETSMLPTRPDVVGHEIGAHRRGCTLAHRTQAGHPEVQS